MNLQFPPEAEIKCLDSLAILLFIVELQLIFLPPYIGSLKKGPFLILREVN